MKVQNLIFAAIVLVSAAAVNAEELNLDFDGGKSASSLNAAAGGRLDSLIRELQLPGSYVKGGIPLPDPECNMGPNGQPCGSPVVPSTPSHPQGPHYPPNPSTPVIHNYPGAPLQHPDPFIPQTSDGAMEGAFVGAVCVVTGWETKCFSQTKQQASVQLTGYIYSQYVKADSQEAQKRVVRFIFPKNLTQKEIYKALYDTEVAAFKQIQAQLVADIDRITPLEHDTAEQIDTKNWIITNDLKALEKWKKKAIKEAEYHSNWGKVNWNGEYWQFGGGYGAYQQLQGALQGREWYK